MTDLTVPRDDRDRSSPNPEINEDANSRNFIATD